MMDLTIRLDHVGDTDPETLKKFLSRYPKYLVYEEIADKTKKLHYQGIIKIDDKSQYNAIKQRFYDMFPSHKGGLKSMAIARKKSYEVYITKDGKVFASQGYTTEEIEALEAQSYKVGDGQSSLSRAKQWVRDNGVTVASHPKEILMALLDYFVIHGKCEPNDFQLKSLTMSIYGAILKESNPEEYRLYRERRANDILRNIIF